MLSRWFIPVSTHPVLWCTVAFIFGIAAYDYSESNLAHILTGSLFHIFFVVVCLFVCVIIFISSQLPFTPSVVEGVMGTLPKIKRVPTHVAVILTSFSLGALCLQYNTHHYQKLAITISDGPKEIIAQVISIDDNQRKPFKTKLCISITSISQHNKTARIAANAQLFLIKKPYLGIGDTILIKNLSLKQPVSQQRYLFKEGYIATAHIPALSYTIINHPKWSFTRMRASVQKRMLGMTTKKLSRDAAALFCPLFLGASCPKANSSVIRAQHAQWGIVHFLARSGLHVMLLAACWHYLLSFFPLHFFLKQLMLILLILLYHLFTFPSISFLRALITYILYKICVLQNLSYNPLHILSLTTLGVLIVNPFQLFFLDFQLSFGLTFALAWFNEVRLRRQRLAQLEQ